MLTPDSAIDVSVVIPTTGRPDLMDAVRSARRQLDVMVEIIVVVDAPEYAVDVDAVAVVCDKVLWTGGGRGAGYARNLGVEHSRGRWVGHLDDDDRWLPHKLKTQLEVGEPLRRTGRPVLLSSRVALRGTGDRGGFPVPAMTITPGQPVADYLFAGRGLAPDRPALFSSSLLVDRLSATSCTWDESLRRHQDWDWVLRFSRLPGCVLIQLPEVLGEQFVGSTGSISASVDWESSLRWGRRSKNVWSARTYSDFMAGQVLRFALSARSPRGAGLVVRELIGAAPPSGRSLLLALSGLVPRSVLTQVAFLSRRQRSTDVRSIAPVNGPVAELGRC